jgi:hypothetical protein
VAWEDLDSELGELFGEFTTRADAMQMALVGTVSRQTAQHREHARTWRQANRHYHNAYKRAWAAAKRMNEPDYREAERERLRARYAADEAVRQKEIARVMAWQRENREKVRATKRAYMQRVRAAKTGAKAQQGVSV